MRLRGAWVLLGLAACAHGGAELGEGRASFYGPGLAGHCTADGERFDPTQLTAAHRTLPFGTCVKVTNLTNGREVEVRVNDRGPFVSDRIIDVSKAAAQQLGMLEAGVARVRLRRCRPRARRRRPPRGMQARWSSRSTPRR
jgi:rare lipoprotein A (peptidoglycan hydrolase)